jgi:hypothetical protein
VSQATSVGLLVVSLLERLAFRTDASSLAPGKTVTSPNGFNQLKATLVLVAGLCDFFHRMGSAPQPAWLSTIDTNPL